MNRGQNMRNRKLILNAAEGLVLVGLIIFIISMLSSGSSKNLPITQIQTEMLQQEGMADLVQKDDSAVNSAFGIIPSEYIYYKTDDIMDVRELFLAKAADDDEMEEIENAVSDHLNTQIDNFTGYGTNQIDLLEHAVSQKKGDYYFFAVGENAEQWQEAFLKLVG